MSKNKFKLLGVACLSVLISVSVIFTLPLSTSNAATTSYVNMTISPDDWDILQESWTRELYGMKYSLEGEDSSFMLETMNDSGLTVKTFSDRYYMFLSWILSDPEILFQGGSENLRIYGTSSSGVIAMVRSGYFSTSPITVDYDLVDFISDNSSVSVMSAYTIVIDTLERLSSYFNFELYSEDWGSQNVEIFSDIPYDFDSTKKDVLKKALSLGLIVPVENEEEEDEGEESDPIENLFTPNNTVPANRLLILQIKAQAILSSRMVGKVGSNFKVGGGYNTVPVLKEYIPVVAGYRGEIKGYTLTAYTTPADFEQNLYPIFRVKGKFTLDDNMQVDFAVKEDYSEIIGYAHKDNRVIGVLYGDELNLSGMTKIYSFDMGGTQHLNLWLEPAAMDLESAWAYIQSQPCAGFVNNIVSDASSIVSYRAICNYLYVSLGHPPLFQLDSDIVLDNPFTIGFRNSGLTNMKNYWDSIGKYYETLRNYNGVFANDYPVILRAFDWMKTEQLVNVGEYGKKVLMTISTVGNKQICYTVSFYSDKRVVSLTSDEISLAGDMSILYEEYTKTPPEIFDSVPSVQNWPMMSGEISDDYLDYCINLWNIFRLGSRLNMVNWSNQLVTDSQFGAEYSAFIYYDDYRRSEYGVSPHAPYMYPLMSQAQYDIAQAVCFTGNLAPNASDPATAILSWLKDSTSASWYSRGHRHKLLSSRIDEVGLGAAPSWTHGGFSKFSVAIFNGNVQETDNPLLISFPFNGITPFAFSGSVIDRWSIDVSRYLGVPPSTTEVVVKRLNDDSVWVFKALEGRTSLYVSGSRLSFSGLGIVLEPGDVFEVTIKNLVDLQGNKISDQTYRSVIYDFT